MLGLLQKFPSFVDVADGLALLGCVRRFVIGPHLRLQGEQKDFQVAFFHEFGRLLKVAIRIEFAKLILDASKTIGEIARSQFANFAFDPFQQIGCEGLVFLNHFVAFHGNPDNLSNTFALHRLQLHLAKVVIVSDDISDDGFLIRSLNVDIFHVQKLDQVELLLSRVKRVVQIVHGVRLGQPLILNEVGSMLVNNRVEGQTVPPRRRKVSNVDVVIPGRLHLAPEQQSVLG